MRYPGWMLLIAGLMAVPQWTYSAEGWRTTAYNQQGFVLRPINAPIDSRFPANAPWVRGPAMPHYDSMGAPLQAQGYRFRPWDGPGSSRGGQRPTYPRPYTASYWGGGPVSALPVSVPRPPAVVADHPLRHRVPVWGPAQSHLNYAPENLGAAPWSGRKYRFRPMPQTRPTQGDRLVRYRPLEVRIPERYVFRPLNPIARSAAPLPPPRVAPFYAPGVYPPVYNGYSPEAPVLVGRYAPNHVATPYAAMPDVRSPAQRWAWRTPMPAAPAPAYVQGVNPQARFRPESRHGRGSIERWDSGGRYVRHLPGWRYPYPSSSPYWAQHSRPARYALPGYGFDGSVAQRPPVAPRRLNRYGTDWYDGRGDGDGAWYRLAVETAPPVSQAWETGPGISGDIE